jgi:predicted nucleic acid-binding Zn ribbon protein
MPKYFYKCTSCEVVVAYYHAMSDCRKDCAECGTPESLVKRPSSFNLESPQHNNKKTGQIVKQSIEDFKEDLESQKQELTSQLYKENE